MRLEESKCLSAKLLHELNPSNCRYWLLLSIIHYSSTIYNLFYNLNTLSLVIWGACVINLM